MLWFGYAVGAALVCIAVWIHSLAEGKGPVALLAWMAGFVFLAVFIGLVSDADTAARAAASAACIPKELLQ